MADCPDIISTTITDKTTGVTSTRSYEEVVEDAQSTLCNVLDADFLAKGVAAGLSTGNGALIVYPATVPLAGPLVFDIVGDLPNGSILVLDPDNNLILRSGLDWNYADGSISFTGTSGIGNGSFLYVIYTIGGVASTPPTIDPDEGSTVVSGIITSEEITLTVNALLVSETPVDPLGVQVWYGGVKMDNALVVGGTGDYTVSGKTITTIATGVIPDGSTLTIVYQK